MSKKLMTKGEMLPGTATEAGTAAQLHTGSWRTYAPLTDYEKCTSCMLCWVYCPDSAVVVRESRKTGTDYQYCKGCGICAVQCPVSCIEMKLDSELTDAEREAERPQPRSG